MNVDFAAADRKILPDEQIAVLQAISLPLPQQCALRDFEQTNCFWIERRTEGPYIELTHSASGQCAVDRTQDAILTTLSQHEIR